jgi:hypothetical protein
MTDLMHKAEVQEMVRAAYRALDPPAGAGSVYYDPTQLAQVPAGAVAWSLGVGNPPFTPSCPSARTCRPGAAPGSTRFSRRAV